MRVVCIAAECEPWAKTGGLGDVVDALARAVGATGKAESTDGRRRRARAAAAVTPRKKPRVPQSQVWMGTGAVMAVGKGEADLPGHVEPPVDVFLPRYRGIVVPEGAHVHGRLRCRIHSPRAAPPRCRSSSSRTAAIESG
jgi:hypothetical protein